MHKDLLVRRIYEYKGVHVVVELDFQKKTASLVEKDGELKRWLFAERGRDYMNGWLLIIQAMEFAVKQAKKELDDFHEKDMEDFGRMLMAIQNPGSLKGK